MSEKQTPIIDAQVHAYERDHPGRPWAAVLTGPPSANGAEMVAAMDAVGVDGAILVSAYTMYRYDPSFALEVCAEHPGRFGLVTPFDAADPEVGDKVSDWAAKKDTVGVRLLLTHGISDDAGDEGISRLLDAAQRQDLPVNVYCTQRHEQVAQIARQFPDVSLVVDHMGLVVADLYGQGREAAEAVDGWQAGERVVGAGPRHEGLGGGGWWVGRGWSVGSGRVGSGRGGSGCVGGGRVGSSGWRRRIGGRCVCRRRCRRVWRNC